MDPSTFLPLLLPLVAWPVAAFAVPRLPPQVSGWLLTATCVTLAAGSTATLLLLAFAGLSEVSQAWPLTAGAGLALVWIAVAVARTGLRYRRWSSRVHRELDTHSREPGVVVLPGVEPLAFAVPGRGGRIAVSSGMLAALDPAERAALLAHERTHLRCRHHLFSTAVTIATLLNPLLRPLREATVFALERWADEVAAARIGDRRVVARAVAKAALASRDAGTFALAATGGPVPRRVSALLAPPSPARRRRSAWLSLTGVGVAAALGVAGWSVQSVVEAAGDLHSSLEVCESHPVLGKRADTQPPLLTHREERRQCPERGLP